MDKLESHTLKEAIWRNHSARHVTSGKSIAAFCRDEAISAANFYVWRKKLANGGNEQVARPAPQAEFIDLGAVNSTIGTTAIEHSPALARMAMADVDIRIALGSGVVLTIARR